MTTFEWILSAVALSAAVYLGLLVVLVLAGRRGDVAALARLIPDCIVLFRRLLADARVSRSRKMLLGLLLVYVAMPLDFVPDFIPVAGQLDDAILVAFVLRSVLRDSGSALVREHWPGPDQSLALVLRITGPAASSPPA
jgi:uncharacterized membrane protein YkvA (DUF1232 family)